MMYGYGGFSISLLPGYRSDVPAWLELGGIFVTVNLRGGAEYGEAWHKAGTRSQAERVRRFHRGGGTPGAREVHTPERLGMMGGSNGGLLVGAVMEQRPELFAAAMPAVGVMDMLRYDQFTGGKLWATEYGSSSDPRHSLLVRIFAAAQPEAGHVLSGDARDHGRSRRSRRAKPLVQVHGSATGGAGMRSADPDSRRDRWLARLPAHGSI